MEPRAPQLVDTEPETEAEFLGLVGKVLAGKYSIEGLIGMGGMGIVASARQLELERPVAIKLLRRSLSQDARLMQRFQREARAIARMRSEHVVRVFDVGVTEDLPFIVMERLDGSDLATELARGPLPAETVVEYVLQACEAIAEAHALGIVHRDIKPSNLFLASGMGSRRKLKVLDFGVSKWLHAGTDSASGLITGERSMLGTPAYASPEQLTRPDSVDRRADIWSLGVVLFHCLSGRLPFEVDSVARLCAEILTCKTPSLANVSRPLNRVVKRCLQKDPALRYADIAELVQALAPFAPNRALHLVESATAIVKEASRAASVPREDSADTGDTSRPSTASEFTQDAVVESSARRSKVLPWVLGLTLAAGVAVAWVSWRWARSAPAEVSSSSVKTTTSVAATGSPVSHASSEPARASTSSPEAVVSAVPAPPRKRPRAPRAVMGLPSANPPPSPVLPTPAASAAGPSNFDSSLYRR